MTYGFRFLIKLHGKIVAFAGDQKGSVLPLTAFAIMSMFAVGTLAMDIPRYFELQTQLQKAADAFALAGAAELDGRPAIGGQGDAISRASSAISSLMASYNSGFSGTGSSVKITASAPIFLESLSATDAAAGGGTVTADPQKARFVHVEVSPVSINAFFPFMASMFGAASKTMTARASAVAGFSSVACRTTPLFICNPYEAQTPGIYDPANKGKMFVLKKGPQTNGTPYSAGNYGFLSVDGNGAKVLKDALAAKDSGACFAQDGVTTEPGNVAAAGDWLNVRFDLFSASAKGLKNNTDFPVARNVRKGCLPDKGPAADTCGQDYNTSVYYCNNYPDPGPLEPIPAYGLPEDLSHDPATGVG
ncbi:MAG: pilus assembly protein TadG-related protein, partial [Beijerinckiaceae bacterium]|nr:pilus assembly protein TadG-related protein [Beijerinckiaceae bacterium]